MGVLLSGFNPQQASHGPLGPGIAREGVQNGIGMAAWGCGVRDGIRYSCKGLWGWRLDPEWLEGNMGNMGTKQEGHKDSSHTDTGHNDSSHNNTMLVAWIRRNDALYQGSLWHWVGTDI